MLYETLSSVHALILLPLHVLRNSASACSQQFCPHVFNLQPRHKQSNTFSSFYMLLRIIVLLVVFFVASTFSMTFYASLSSSFSARPSRPPCPSFSWSSAYPVAAAVLDANSTSGTATKIVHNTSTPLPEHCYFP